MDSPPRSETRRARVVERFEFETLGRRRRAVWLDGLCRLARATRFRGTQLTRGRRCSNRRKGRSAAGTEIAIRTAVVADHRIAIVPRVLARARAARKHGHQHPDGQASESFHRTSPRRKSWAAWRRYQGPPSPNSAVPGESAAFRRALWRSRDNLYRLQRLLSSAKRRRGNWNNFARSARFAASSHALAVLAEGSIAHLRATTGKPPAHALYVHQPRGASQQPSGAESGRTLGVWRVPAKFDTPWARCCRQATGAAGSSRISPGRAGRRTG